ncbi:RIO1-domain-containing protein [Myriangium duriaei CBS 260.36]|uniref:Serine/threonine-protein kinase RIO2 n=1 Tax=Myriangium duriaei CBS 260.36 TaxID=1168546 RepID=A0A9P4IZ52_9PEZI|nr:RIO1-domain-containing protein [Myriangium duriaei CBS 260.36]
MKLNPKAIRYLTSEDWRVLTAVETGSRNHEVVPTPLIAQLSGLRGGSGVHKCISNLAKVNLIAKVKNAKYDGYRLTYGGLDYLALNSHRKSGCIFSLGNQIGVGKESDIYVVASDDGRQCVLKLHRLGRISFRTVKANRDYLRNRSTGSWMYLSRLAAMKEYAFMQVLRREGFAVPEPVGQSRHTIVMEFIDAFPLRQIDSVPDPAKLYAELMDTIVRLARVGLIHGDFNEFNLLIKESSTPNGDTKLSPVLIDFPQMLSTTHPNAQFYFDRDVACIKRFFLRRFKFEADEPGPFFADAIKESDKSKRLDVEVEATGFNRKMAKDLDKYIELIGRGDETEEGDQLQPESAEDQSLPDEDQEGDEAHDQVEGNEKDADFEEAEHEEAAAAIPEWTSSSSKGFAFEPLGFSDDAKVGAAATKQQASKKASGWAI